MPNNEHDDRWIQYSQFSSRLHTPHNNQTRPVAPGAQHIVPPIHDFADLEQQYGRKYRRYIGDTLEVNSNDPYPPTLALLVNSVEDNGRIYTRGCKVEILLTDTEPIAVDRHVVVKVIDPVAIRFNTYGHIFCVAPGDLRLL